MFASRPALSPCIRECKSAVSARTQRRRRHIASTTRSTRNSSIGPTGESSARTRFPSSSNVTNLQLSIRYYIMLARNLSHQAPVLTWGAKHPCWATARAMELCGLGRNPAERQDGVSGARGGSYKIEHRECIIRPCLHGAGSCGNTLIKIFEGLKRWSAPCAPVLILSISVRFQIGAHREFSLSYSNGLASIAKTCREMLGWPNGDPHSFPLLHLGSVPTTCEATAQ